MDPTALLQKLDNVTTKVWYVPDSHTNRQGRRGSSKTYRAVNLRQEILNVLVLQLMDAFVRTKKKTHSKSNNDEIKSFITMEYKV